ncbi:MAG: helix-turn-helix transcriptional regulator, partial [Spirochaetaceae bacterium]|nr:helix-turn-helix transcriptional regulator [Spirochaetaceae bacterium]
VILMGPTVLHTVEVSKTDHLFVTSVYFLRELVFSPGEPDSNFDWLRPFYDQHAMRNPIIGNDHTEVLTDHFHDLVETQAHTSRYRNLQTRINLLQVLLAALKEYDIDYTDRFSQSVASNANRLDRVLTWMNKRYQDKLRLSDVADIACMSTQHFCRFFKRTTGHTFTEHLSRIRVAHAKQLLLQRNLRVTDIAYEVGFGSQSYFFRAFRQITGTTPREFLANGSSRGPDGGSFGNTPLTGMSEDFADHQVAQ